MTPPHPFLFVFVICMLPYTSIASPTSKPTSRPAHAFQRLLPNKTYHVRFERSVTVQQTAFGTKHSKVFRAYLFDYDIRLLTRHKDGNTTLSLTHKRVRFHTRVGLHKETYDSQFKTKKIPAMAWAAAALPGKTWHVTFSRKGDVLSVKGLKSYHTSLVERLKRSPMYRYLTPSHVTYMLKQRWKIAGATQLKREQQLVWLSLPKAGATQWTRTILFPIYGMTLKSTCHRTSTASKSIRCKGNLAQPKDGLTPFGINVTKHIQYKLKGTYKGAFVHHHATDLPIGGGTQVVITGHMIHKPKKGKKPRFKHPVFIEISTKFSTRAPKTKQNHLKKRNK